MNLSRPGFITSLFFLSSFYIAAKPPVGKVTGWGVNQNMQTASIAAPYQSNGLIMITNKIPLDATAILMADPFFCLALKENWNWCGGMGLESQRPGNRQVDAGFISHKRPRRR